VAEESFRWMVYRQDTHGNRVLVEGNLSEAQAEELLASFSRNKPHKMDYFKVRYTASSRKQVLDGERVQE
jgi:hypothetical protein